MRDHGTGGRTTVTMLIGPGLLLWACGGEPVEPTTTEWDATSTALAVSGELDGTATPGLLSDTAPVYRVDVDASGAITGVGDVRAEWTLPEVILNVANGNGTARDDSWSAVITAADGDRIEGRYKLRSTIVQVGGTGSFHAIADLEMTGGTGRFAGTAGTGVSVIDGNIVTRHVHVSVEGELLRAAAR